MSLWKLRREFERLGAQLLEPYRQLRDMFLRLHYRLQHEKLVAHFKGQVIWSERVAVLLFYQPAGLPESILRTCSHLREQGYACVLVSNGPVPQADIDRLLPAVTHLIVRPNFGYDFGGYQEGMLWLRQKNIKVRHLLLLNDSIWFPVFEKSDFLFQMEAANADVVGALSAERGRSQRHRRKLFYASFMLLFSEKVWLSEEFENFWRHYRQTSSKPRTIRKGERMLSALFIHDDQFTHQAMIDGQTFHELAGDFNALEWGEFSKELSLMDTFFGRQRQDLLVSGAQAKPAAWRDWYEGLCESQNMFACAQTALVVRKKSPFIKKSKDPHNLSALKQGLTSFEAIPDFDELVLKELKQTLVFKT